MSSQTDLVETMTHLPHVALDNGARSKGRIGKCGRLRMMFRGESLSSRSLHDVGERGVGGVWADSDRSSWQHKYHTQAVLITPTNRPEESTSPVL